jgi:hypothetical protein
LLPRRAFLNHRLHLLVAQTVGEHTATLPSCGAWPSSRGRVPALCAMSNFEQHRAAVLAAE